MVRRLRRGLFSAGCDTGSQCCPLNQLQVCTRLDRHACALNRLHHSHRFPPPFLPFLLSSLPPHSGCLMAWRSRDTPAVDGMSGVDGATGAARRRRERRLLMPGGMSSSASPRPWQLRRTTTRSRTVLHGARRQPPGQGGGGAREHRSATANGASSTGSGQASLRSLGRSVETAPSGTPQGTAQRPSPCLYWLGRQVKPSIAPPSPSSLPRRWRSRGRKRRSDRRSRKRRNRCRRRPSRRSSTLGRGLPPVMPPASSSTSEEEKEETGLPWGVVTPVVLRGQRAPRQLTPRVEVRAVSVCVAGAGSPSDSREGATRGQCAVPGLVARAGSRDPLLPDTRRGGSRADDRCAVVFPSG